MLPIRPMSFYTAGARSLRRLSSSSWRETPSPAMHGTSLGGDKGAVQCHLSPRHCKILPGKTGFCGVRGNVNGELVTYNYGRSVEAALETIETESVYHYQPGAGILSLGNIGCMMSCTFCHNWQTSQVKYLSEKSVHHYTPQQIVDMALENNIGVLSWTYNDPVVWHEFVLDTAALGQKHGIKSLYKSAFYIEEAPINELVDVIDIFSLSLKSMDEKWYRKVTKGRLGPILKGMEQVHKSGRHLEVSQLTVTDMNDTDDQIRDTAKWVVDALSSDVPLHFVRFHPAFKYTHVPRTPLDRLHAAKRIAIEEGVKHVYLGNMYEPGAADTTCSNCNHTLVKRFGLNTEVVGINRHTNACAACNHPSPIHDAFGAKKPASATSAGSDPFAVCTNIFAKSASDLETQETSWSEEVNSVHVSLSDPGAKLVVVREPQDKCEVIEKTLGRVILSKSAHDETGVRVFSDRPFEHFAVLDRAHFPVSANERDGKAHNNTST